MSLDNESLHDFFVRRIAEKDGVKPEEVTEDYILKQRAEKIYPTARFEVCSNLGGYKAEERGLTVLTQEEMRFIKDTAYSSFSALYSD